MTKIIKRSPHGKTDKGWWIITNGHVYWGQSAKPGYGYGPSIGFDTKKEAVEFAVSEGLFSE